MNIGIEKIDNGFIVTIGNKKTFCSEAMSICGLLAEWAQAEVERLEKSQSVSSTYAEAQKKILEYMNMPQVMLQPLDDKEVIKSLLSDWY